MKAGVYRIVFSGFGEAAAGVAIVRGAEIVGGDNNFYYSGRLKQDGERLSGRIEAMRHSAGPASAFGPLSEVTLELTGTVSGGGAKLTGAATQMPAVSAAVTLSPIMPFAAAEGDLRPEPRPARAPATAASRGDCPFVEDDEDRRAEAPCLKVGWLDKPMSDLQLRLLAALWRLGEAPAVELHQALAPTRMVALSTIGHALADMERRRLISHRSQGFRHLYRAEVVADQVVQSLARSLSTVAETLYEGDRGSLLQRLMMTVEMGAGEPGPQLAPTLVSPAHDAPGDAAVAGSGQPGIRSRTR